MSSNPQKAYRSDVDRVLQDVSAQSVRHGADRWEFALEGRPILQATAQLSDDWLEIMAPRDFDGDRRMAGDLQGLLVANGELPPRVKYTLTPDGVLASRVDIALSGENSLEPQLRDALHLLGRAIGGSCPAPEHGASDDATETPPSEAVDALKSACADSGWSIESRSESEHLLRFESNGRQTDAYSVHVTVLPTESVRFTIELAVHDDLSEASRNALHVFLLTGSHAHRVVRPVAKQEDQRTSFALEYLASHIPDSEEVRHVLGSLVLAFDALAREVKALRDERKATQYVLARGWSMGKKNGTSTKRPDKAVNKENA